MLASAAGDVAGGERRAAHDRDAAQQRGQLGAERERDGEVGERPGRDEFDLARARRATAMICSAAPAGTAAAGEGRIAGVPLSVLAVDMVSRRRRAAR